MQAAHTVHARTLLVVLIRRLDRRRGCLRLDSWRRLRHLMRRRLLGLFLRRGQARTTLAGLAGHDGAEDVARAVADGRRRRV